MTARQLAVHAPSDTTMPPRVGPMGWLRRHVFATPMDVALGLVLLIGAVVAMPRIVAWAWLDSVVVADSPASCAAAVGACWAVVYAHGRAIVFGLYPYAEQWRPAAALMVIAVALIATFLAGATRMRAVVITWIVAAVLFMLLMRGGVLSLPLVATDAWGGLPLSIFVFITTILFGFPLAILLALGRGSRLSVVRIVCTAAIELVRSLPILTILFCAAIVIPLMLPEWLNPDKVIRVIAAMAFFYACFQAEIIRGGLQGVPATQRQAALSLGMTPLQVQFQIELPQALRYTVPATINQMVVALKDTSMLLVVGLFDFIASANTAITKDEWSRYFTELYLFVALTFLAMTSVLSALERRFVGSLQRG